MYQRGTPTERFWSKVTRPEEGCWVWTAGMYQGYGRFREGGAGSRNVLAHRWVWEQEHGPIPEGLELDHLCRNRACVRLAHLELVTPGINKSRQVGSRWRSTRTHCKQGHEWSAENTRLRRHADGRTTRECRQCDRDRYERLYSPRAESPRLNPVKMGRTGCFPDTPVRSGS